MEGTGIFRSLERRSVDSGLPVVTKKAASTVPGETIPVTVTFLEISSQTSAYRHRRR